MIIKFWNNTNFLFILRKMFLGGWSFLKFDILLLIERGIGNRFCRIVFFVSVEKERRLQEERDMAADTDPLGESFIIIFYSTAWYLNVGLGFGMLEWLSLKKVLRRN